MDSLNKKIAISLKVVLKAYRSYPTHKTVVAWTGGKDSTVLLHLIREAFHGVVPFPVMFNDSTMEFDEVYQFIKRLTELWKLNLVIVTHDANELRRFHAETRPEVKMELSRIMKIHALHTFQKQRQIAAYFAGIRRDEHTARSRETYFSKRTDHVRIHPILHFTEQDIWEYIHTHQVPYVSLYDQGYRSLGEKPFTAKSQAGKGERSGRDQEKELLMEKLRGMGYW